MLESIDRRTFLKKFVKSLLLSYTAIFSMEKKLLKESKNLVLSSSIPIKKRQVTYYYEKGIVVFLYKNKKYEFNKTASLIWDNCNGKNTVREISRKISKDFGINFDSALVDTINFLEKLRNVGMITYE